MAARKHSRTKPHARKPVTQPVRTDWAPAFLAALSAGQSVTDAAQIAGVGRRTVYDRRKSDPAFQLDMSDALDDACDALETEARRRALLKRKGSDQLLMFLLRAHRPEVYGAKVDHTHSGRVTLTVEEMTDEELQRIAGAADPAE